MGGNVKDAFTEEPTVKSTCEVCNRPFEHAYKHSRQVCPTCKEEKNTPENLTARIETDISMDKRQLTITITLESTVHDNISIDVPTDSVEGEHIVGVLRVIGDDDSDWYEDAWVEYPDYTGVSVKRGSRTYTFTYPIEAPDADNTKNKQQHPAKYGNSPETSVREEYQSSAGNLFNADELNITFEFVSPEIDSITETVGIPDYLVDL